MSIRRFLQDYPAFAFFAVVIGWSYPFMWIVLTLLPLDPVRGPRPEQILLIAVGTSPTLFGLIMARLAGRSQALRGIFSRLTPARASLIWYILALLVVPALNLMTYFICAATGGQAYPLPTTEPVFAILAGIMTASLEEFGWRGFALPELQKRYSAFSSSLILGLAWGIWHLPLFWLQRAHYGLVAVPILFLESLSSLTALSVLMTWIHNNTRQSLLLMILFHFSLTAGNFLLQPPAASTATDYLRFHLILAVIHWSLVGIVVAFAGAKSLVRRSYSGNTSIRG